MQSPDPACRRLLSDAFFFLRIHSPPQPGAYRLPLSAFQSLRESSGNLTRFDTARLALLGQMCREGNFAISQLPFYGARQMRNNWHANALSFKKPTPVYIKRWILCKYLWLTFFFHATLVASTSALLSVLGIEEEGSCMWYNKWLERWCSEWRRFYSEDWLILFICLDDLLDQRHYRGEWYMRKYTWLHDLIYSQKYWILGVFVFRIHILKKEWRENAGNEKENHDRAQISSC